MAYKKYLDKCFKILEKGKDCKLRCWVRIYIAHLIVAACKWKCFANKDRRYKEFYLICIGMLSK